MVLALPLVLISKNVLLLTLILPLVLALPIKSELISDIGPGLLFDRYQKKIEPAIAQCGNLAIFTIIKILAFFSHGKFVARHPIKIIIISSVLASLCGLGLFRFYEEKNMVNLWIPENVDFSKNHKWLMERFPPTLR